MKRFTPAWCALASALACALAGEAARPQYGGTLIVELAVPRVPSLPDADKIEGPARDRIRALVFDTLVAAGPNGAIRPQLATRWESDARAKRWRLTLRKGVKLHDLSTLTVQDVVDALNRLDTPWRVTAESDGIAIDTDRPLPELLWHLAEPYYGVAASRGNKSVGTGAFVFDAVDAAGVASLHAHEEHWAGRPFVDTVQIRTGRPLPAQAQDLELGRAQIVSASPLDARRLTQRGARIVVSSPNELLALVFQPNRAGAADAKLRRALSAAIDRRSIAEVLLQRLGDPAWSVVPSALAGYSALLENAEQRGSIRSLVSSLTPRQRSFTVRFDGADPLLRAVAERLVADVRDVGLSIVLDPERASLRPIDARLIRVQLDTMMPSRALSMFLATLQPQARRAVPAAPDPAAPIETIFAFERSLADTNVIMPLVHVRDVYGVAAQIESWNTAIVSPVSTLDLGNVWLRRPSP